MINNPLISVVLCVYKTPESFFVESIESILNQSYTYFELILVDDGSPDNCPQICDEYAKKDRRIIVIHKENGGISSARNAGLSVAKGKYIAIMDSDDIALPKRFEKQVEYLEKNKNVVALGTYYKHFGNKNNTVMVPITNMEEYRCSLFFNNVPTILNPSVMIRFSTLKENNLSYDERLKFAEDYFLWVRLSEIGDFAVLPEVLMCYRVHSNQSTNWSVRKTRDRNKYLINMYQLSKIGISLDKNDINIYFCNYAKTYSDIKKAKKLLTLISNANKNSNYYSCDVFDKTCIKYIYECMSRIRNPFTIIMFLLTKGFNKLMRRALKDKMLRHIIKK